jgi:hypothetical protein
MLSDLNHHPETALKDPYLPMIGMLCATNNDVNGARRFIEGFN